MNQNFAQLEARVLAWAADRGIGAYGQTLPQLGKMEEEVQEVHEAIYDCHPDMEVKKEIGDVLVTVILLANTLETNVTECLELAYEKIKDRKGRTINGVFVKAEDLPPDLDSIVDEDPPVI